MMHSEGEAAITKLQTLTQQDPYMTDAVVKLAELELKVLKDPAKALVRLSHAIKVDPRNPEA